MNQKEIKQELLHKCKEHLSIRRDGVEGILANIKVSLQEETKSSAGDKHETGRAMLQLEREKAGPPLAQIKKLEFVLHRISDRLSNSPVHLGSVVETTQKNYFLSIPVGEIEVENKLYYALGATSPLGKSLLGKKKGDTIHFRENQFKITLVY